MSGAYKATGIGDMFLMVEGGKIEAMCINGETAAKLARKLNHYDSAIEALKAIANDTDADSKEENLRQDDREACLDIVFATATKALADSKAHGK